MRLLWRRGALAQQRAPHARNARNPEPAHPARCPRAPQVDPARWPPLQQLAAESGRALVVDIILGLHLTYLLKLSGGAPRRRSRSSRQSICWCAAAVSRARAPARLLHPTPPQPFSYAMLRRSLCRIRRRSGCMVAAGRATSGRRCRWASCFSGPLAPHVHVRGSVGCIGSDRRRLPGVYSPPQNGANTPRACQ